MASDNNRLSIDVQRPAAMQHTAVHCVGVQPDQMSTSMQLGEPALQQPVTAARHGMPSPRAMLCTLAQHRTAVGRLDSASCMQCQPRTTRPSLQRAVETSIGPSGGGAGFAVCRASTSRMWWLYARRQTTNERYPFPAGRQHAAAAGRP